MNKAGDLDRNERRAAERKAMGMPEPPPPPFMSMTEKVQRFLDDPYWLNFVMGKNDARKLIDEITEAAHKQGWDDCVKAAELGLTEGGETNA